MKNIKFVLVISLLSIFLPAQLAAQGYLYGVIKGQVVDKEIQQPIIGALVTIYRADSEALVEEAKIVTDLDGYFMVENLPIGRHTVKVSSIGLITAFRRTIEVQPSKETFLSIEMDHNVYELEQVVITLEKEPSNKINNEMVCVSGQTFHAEETERYAGALNDPARMIRGFAGVSSGNDSRNDIIVRGNSPLWVQYRIDGFVTPNPSHFSSIGNAGGSVSMLNNNQLSKSDFLTGAFPSEYHNVLGAVFDLRMRRGNYDKKEHTFQVGFNGFEFGTEGPISKKNNSSYMFNYRYSTLGLLNAVGLSLGTAAIPEYQDLNYKIYYPTDHMGIFSTFGVLGKASISLLGSESDDDLYSQVGEDIYDNSAVAMLGISNEHFIKDKGYGILSLSWAGTKTTTQIDSLSPKMPLSKTLEYGESSLFQKYTLSYSYTHKLNKKMTLRSGLVTDFYKSNFEDSVVRGDRYIMLTDVYGSTWTTQLHTTLKYKFYKNWSATGGVNFNYFGLNDHYVLEPRLGINYQFKPQHSFHFGAGMHSQLVPFVIYFAETEIDKNEYQRTNENLDYTKSAQVIFGYDFDISPSFRFRTEVYYQAHYNTPITKHASSYSVLNEGEEFFIERTDNLVNEGRGRNYGVELSLNKNLSSGLYFMSTMSLYRSEYTGSDEVWRATAFDNEHLFNLLGGKEWRVHESLSLFFDLKLTWSGGRKFTPIDLEMSKITGKTIYKEEAAYSEQYPDYFKLDIKVGFKQFFKKVTSELYIDIQNVTNRQNIFNRRYSNTTEGVIEVYQLGLFPMVTYRLRF